ncbi:hypothetical protein VF21_02963 [Pseudogymnoascus sp. 05NY08]|nr:hypothetical protein VF21_02963 [Pseudogymnoascus sp. 05NY08]
MSSTPMDVDSPRPAPNANGGIGLSRSGINVPAIAKVSDIISNFRPTRLFKRDYHNEPTTVLSLDFDDKGELLMTSETDESIQLYNVLDGTFNKSLFSKKYGVKHAKFTHKSTSIIYASTKENNDIRYLATHDNSFLRYFKGHTGSVTCLTMNPGSDTFVSSSLDNTVRIWDLNSVNPIGMLNINSPHLTAFDPSACVLAIASPAAQTILLYDIRKFEKEPFASFDLYPFAKHDPTARAWRSLDFSNDGKSLLVGTAGNTHFVLDAFDGKLKHGLIRKSGGTRRLSLAKEGPDGEDDTEARHHTSGDVCFSPDGRYVLSGQQRNNVLVYDITGATQTGGNTPMCELESKNEVAAIRYNPRFNMFATADRELNFWVPDRDSV